MDCSDVLKQGTKPLGVDVDGVAFLESTLDEISSICSNEADPIAPWANTSRVPHGVQTPTNHSGALGL